MFRTVTYKINKEKNGIELQYGYIPSIDIRNTLKKNGWRWNPKDKVWYTRYTEEALMFAKKQSSQTEKRQDAINKMPVFYRKHCGCEEEYLPFLEESVFYKYVKQGSLKSIAIELLNEYVRDDARALLRELYIQSTKNENYRKELLNKTSKDLFAITRDGSVKLSNAQYDSSYGTGNNLDLQQGVFWTNLKIFGINLKPIDRLAYSVSNYRDKCLANKTPYYSASSIQERYLFSIVGDLTLEYNDTLVQIIKNHLKEEIKECLAQNEGKNFYILALYSLIINDRNQADCFLAKYVDQATPKQVILNIERKRWMQQYHTQIFDFGIKEIVLETTYGELYGESEKIQINISSDQICCNYSTTTPCTYKSCKYNCEDKKWLKFANRLFNEFNIFSVSPAEFSQPKVQEDGNIILVDDGPDYTISIQKKDNSILDFKCGEYCVGTVVVCLIKTYFSPPQNVKYKKIDLLDF